MLEPQGTLFLIFLVLAFGGLITWVALANQVVFRVIAACLAFIPAMAFGIFAVNKYYDYYQTWGALYSDLSGQTTSIPHLTAAGLGKGTAGSLKSLIGTANDSQIDEQYGLLFSAIIAGRHTRISRTAYVYLPPQYFQKAYANYKFPAIELLHGSPGDPQAWVNVMNVVPIYLNAMASGKAKPAVLVMPNTDGGQQYGLQCLNDPGGVQDMTYVAEEVPDWAVANLRVQPAEPVRLRRVPQRLLLAGREPGPAGRQGRRRAGRRQGLRAQQEADAAELARRVHHAGSGHGQRPAVLPRGRRHRRG